ncbi:hypothetical protein [Ectobacillus ponti]|uniref:Uncharacterized protein n=1 Tax=Ectobacillus ponti TaxID=2961894 RepID=A0AA41XDQ7_9BACI|nr:hypothetical protein [Ectobacillus ponti]MCP8971018.1 hypothetical protein [Ectobacillus ponti]
MGALRGFALDRSKQEKLLHPYMASYGHFDLYKVLSFCLEIESKLKLFVEKTLLE